MYCRKPMFLMLFILASFSFGLYAQNFIVQYRCIDPAATTQNITFSVNIINNTSNPVSLSELRVRYYYLKEGSSPEVATCDFALIGKELVTGTIGSGYAEITFLPQAGTIAGNSSSGDVQIRINKTDWSTYTQTGDYSFDATKTSFALWEKITLTRNTTLEWGTPPTPQNGTPAPSPIPTATPAPGESPAPTQTPAAATNPPAADDWLHAEGSNVKDRNGRIVRLTGTNWFGFNAPTNAFDGLWQVDMKDSLNQMAMRGFNVLRIPISTELIYNWSLGTYPQPNITTYQVNTYLAGKNSLEVFDAALAHLKSIGMKAIIDVHSAQSDAMGHMHPLWYKDAITGAIFNSSWEWLANRYRYDDTIIGVDLKNEPHGVSWTPGEYAKWDNSNDQNNWKKAVQDVSARILSKNPELLILVEGIESFPIDGVTWTSQNQSDYYNAWWGGNLRGVLTMPINLGAYQDQLVYAPHEYGPNVYAQPWFFPGFNKDTLYRDSWQPNWYYIVERGIAPMYIGEWGGKLDGGDNEIWMYALREFIIEKNLHHTYWCFNANSSDTAGLVGSDWVTWDEEKYAFIKPTLWQDSRGKFVGLDHAIPLYSTDTGTTITEYYENGNPAPSSDPTVAPTPWTTPGPTSTPVTGKTGDVNGNGIVDIVDALLIAQYYVGANPPGFNPLRADVDCNGAIDIIDALLIAQYYVGIIPGLC